MRRLLVLLALVVPLLAVPTVSALAADPPVQFTPPEPLPYSYFDNSPPIPQQDTGNSGTGTLAEGEEATAYPCVGLRWLEWSVQSWTVQMKNCAEDLGDGRQRNKTRITFYYNSPNGRVPAYGNVRWNTSWVHPTYGPPLRRMLWSAGEGWNVFAYTWNRSDAIQVHSTVAYSQSGCVGRLGVRTVAYTAKHFVRMPNGALFGPLGMYSNQPVWSCLP